MYESDSCYITTGTSALSPHSRQAEGCLSRPPSEHRHQTLDCASLNWPPKSRQRDVWCHAAGLNQTLACAGIFDPLELIALLRVVDPRSGIVLQDRVEGDKDFVMIER